MMNAEHISYDYIIIGGGISGLYALKRLHDKYGKNIKVALFDDRDYIGGRIRTHKLHGYEIGAARFNDNHTSLLSLIKKYKLTPYKLQSLVNYIHVENQKIITYHDAHRTFNNIMRNIIQHSKKESDSLLQSMTLEKYIDFITKDSNLSEKLINIFGYYSEMCIMNAYDSLKSFEKDFVSNQFYVLSEGLSTLCEKMSDEYGTFYDIHMNTSVLSVAYNPNRDMKKNKGIVQFNVTTQNTKTKKKLHYACENVVFATKAHQLHQFDILKRIHPLLSKIHSAPLLRIYAKYPVQKGKVWFSDIPRCTTNNILRQIIPINYDTGIIMVSYTDGTDIAPFFRDKTKQNLKSNKILKKMIQSELKTLFGIHDIPEPLHFESYLWHVGAHHWKPNARSVELIKSICFPEPNIYVVGEAFSHNQAWIEGALNSVDNILSSI